MIKKSQTEWQMVCYRREMFKDSILIFLSRIMKALILIQGKTEEN